MLSVESSRGGAKFLEGDRGVFGLTQLLIESIIKASVTASFNFAIPCAHRHHHLRPRRRQTPPRGLFPIPISWIFLSVAMTMSRAKGGRCTRGLRLWWGVL